MPPPLVPLIPRAMPPASGRRARVQSVQSSSRSSGQGRRPLPTDTSSAQIDLGTASRVIDMSRRRMSSTMIAFQLTLNLDDVNQILSPDQ